MAEAAPGGYIERFTRFYREYYEEDVSKLAQGYPKDRRSIYIDYDDLYKFDHSLAHDVKEDPDEMREYAKTALQQFDLPIEVGFDNVHIRIENIDRKVDIRDLRVHDDHIGQLVSLRGVVQDATGIKPQIVHGVFECNQCGAESRIKNIADYYQEPHECHDCEWQGDFSLNTEKSKFVDSQRLLIQESPEELRGGETPQDIIVRVEDDMVGEVNAGDRVTVAGVLHLDPESNTGDTPYYDTYLEGLAINSEEDDLEEVSLSDDDLQEIHDIVNGVGEYPDDIFESVVESIAPSIFGFEEEKLAIGMQLFSGVRKFLPDGSFIRGDIHILLIGDPGTGKSALLNYVSNVAPRSVYTSGKGSSSAGLTASAVPDGIGGSGRWSLQAGALVLADQGVAAIDELDKMAASDRSAMHEALEQQQVSVAKAGITATLKSRCSLLAAANPKHGTFDKYEPVAQQVNLGAALMSRFDLIFPVDDEPDEARDGELADHILDSNYAGELNEKFNSDHIEHSAVTQEDIDTATEDISPVIDVELFRKYILHARQNIFPTLSDEAWDHVQSFYTDLRTRGMDSDSPIPITARKLEAIIRLSEASARIRLSDTISLGDAQRATTIIRNCLEKIGIDPKTGELDADAIETGHTTRQQNQRKQVTTVIEDLSDEFDDGVPLDELVDWADELDLAESDIIDTVERLHRNGILIREGRERYRVV